MPLKVPYTCELLFTWWVLIYIMFGLSVVWRNQCQGLFSFKAHPITMIHRELSGGIVEVNTSLSDRQACSLILIPLLVVRAYSEWLRPSMAPLWPLGSFQHIRVDNQQIFVYVPFSSFLGLNLPVFLESHLTTLGLHFLNRKMGITLFTGHVLTLSWSSNSSWNNVK